MKLSVPVPLRIAALVLGTTALYAHIGQLVPQKIVEPPTETVIRQDMTTADLVQLGQEIANGKGLCFTCHTVGKSGTLRFPDLAGVATRAETRVPGLSGLQYMAHSIYFPNEFIVPGFNKGMPQIDKPPIGLNDQEILAVLAFLQSQGGKPTVTLATTKADLGIQ